MMKESILQENRIILNVYEPNKRILKHGRQKLMELRGKMEYMVLTYCIWGFSWFSPGNQILQADGLLLGKQWLEVRRGIAGAK